MWISSISIFTREFFRKLFIYFLNVMLILLKITLNNPGLTLVVANSDFRIPPCSYTSTIFYFLQIARLFKDVQRKQK